MFLRFLFWLLALNIDHVKSFMIPDFVEWGRCADVKVYPEFDPVKYQGLWFDIKSVPNEYQVSSKCTSQNYTWSGDVMNVYLKGLTSDNEKVFQHAKMSPDDNSKDSLAQMTLQTPGVPSAPYKILWTDYYLVSCVYSCIGYMGVKVELGWILGRTPNLPQTLYEVCNTAFRSYGIDFEKLKTIEQGEGCIYHESLPEILNKSTNTLRRFWKSSHPSNPFPIDLLQLEEQSVNQTLNSSTDHLTGFRSNLPAETSRGGLSSASMGFFISFLIALMLKTM